MKRIHNYSFINLWTLFPKVRHLFWMIFILILAGYPFTQTLSQDVVPEEGTGEMQDVPKIPKHFSNIIIKNNLLTVELVNAAFGEVLNEIAQESGFRVYIKNDDYGKQVTTKFVDIDIERGIVRLLSLIREKNYLFHYNTKGMLSKVEIHGGKVSVTYTSQPTVQTKFQRPGYDVNTPPPLPQGFKEMPGYDDTTFPPPTPPPAFKIPVFKTPPSPPPLPPGFKNIKPPSTLFSPKTNVKSTPIPQKTVQPSVQIEEPPQDFIEPENEVEAVPYLPPKK